MRGRVGERLAGAGIWLALFAVYLRCMPGTYYFEDSPELIACAAALGNTHPPGYPLLMLLGRLAMLVPVGGLAFRFNILGAACAAGASLCLALFVIRLAAIVDPRRGIGLGVAGGCFAAAVWAFSDAFWWQAVIGDKYPLFYLSFGLILVVSSRAMLSGSRPVSARMEATLPLVTGIALAHHPYAVFGLPLAGAAYWVLVSRRRGNLKWLAARLALAVFLAALPLSVKLLYPPIRSEFRPVHDWGRPRNLPAYAIYSSARLYHRGIASTSIARETARLPGRLKLAARLLLEELPLVFLAGIPFGVWVLWRSAPGLLLAAAACAALNGAYVLNFSEKVVRWYEPAYSVIVGLSALGFVAAGLRVKRGAKLVLVVLAIAGAGWQIGRGQLRNDLSSFYGAWDFGRNLLRSLPRGALYLGAGDFDLFPLWAERQVAGTRLDVEAVGVASFLDSHLAGAGNQTRLAARLGLSLSGADSLIRLLRGRGEPPAMIAATGYDRLIYAKLPFLAVNRTHGLAAQSVPAWDALGSYTATRRIVRTYTYRGLRYARAGAITDLKRPRDEVARGALLQYPLALASLGKQCLSFGLVTEAAWAYDEARLNMEALVGGLPFPGTRGGEGPLGVARAGRAAVAQGYERLAGVFAARGVFLLAEQYRDNVGPIVE